MVKYKKKPAQNSAANAPASSVRIIQASAPAPSSQNMLRSMEQERAEYALTKIQGVAAEKDDMQIEVRRHLNGLPALIRMNGLGQALAFYRAKGTEGGHDCVYNMVSHWLCDPASKGRVFSNQTDVLKAITTHDIHAYMAAQNEALALLEWLKKFALALLKKED